MMIILWTWLLLVGSLIEIGVYPTFSTEPSNVVVTISLTRSPNNRRLEWSCDAPTGMYRASMIELDGAESPARYRVEWNSVRAGEYVCQVRLIGMDEKLLDVSSAKFTVQSRY